VLRQEHKAGEKLFVDWAGTTIPIYDAHGGPVQQAHLFVAVLGASSYTYAEATPDEQLANWIGAHVHAFEFYQGVPRLVVPDNTKTGVTKACRYDPDLNPTYQEMAMHYGVGVVPARPYKPRARGHGHTVTVAEHRPRSHQAHLEWTPSRMVHWAQAIGPHTARLFERILADKPHPEMGYRSCLGIIRLAGQYSPARMEAAAERALVTGACRYQSVKSILKNSLDSVPPVEPPPSPPPPPHDNIRGAEYFD
jgi:transposase